jgi:hypothetical protein
MHFHLNMICITGEIHKYTIVVDLTSLQGIFTPSWHLILPLHLSRVCVALHSISFCNCLLDNDYV